MRVGNIFIVLFLLSALNSKEIDYNDAQKLALKWIQKITRTSKKIAKDKAYLPANHKMKLISDVNKPYYIFNLDGGGWIIVADDDINSPVLAYSKTSSLNPYNLPPQFKWWLNSVSKELNTAKRLAKRKRYLKKVTTYKKAEKAYGSINAKSSVGPLLRTAWSQGSGYNEYCPKDSRSVEGNGHVPAGCVAVAMAQIMNYYSWPPRGYGKNSYTPRSYPQYGVQSVDFSNTTYNWRSIDPAKITYHAGVAVNMDYGPYGSGAYLSQAEYAMKMNFRYKASSVTKKYSDAQWDRKLINSLNRNRLVLYQGKGSIVHVFVCDGYKKVDNGYMYHFNWGWNGSGNGWFKISNMTPFGTSNFNRNNYAIFDIYPSDPGYNLDIKQQRAPVGLALIFMLFAILAAGYRGLRA